MSELRSLVAAASSLRQDGEPFLVATLVSVRGSSYRRPGARLLIAEDRWVAGSISGGCLERDLVRRAWWCLGDGQAALVSYDSTSDDDDLGWGIGLGCNGVVELLLERTGAGRPVDSLAFIRGCVRDEKVGALVTIFRTPGGDQPLGACLAMAADGTIVARANLIDAQELASLESQARRALRTAGPAATVTLPSGIEALIEVIEPPPHLFVMGAGPDAVPLVRAARAVGWTITVWAPQSRRDAERQLAEADHVRSGAATALAPAVATAHRPIAVVMTHNAERDCEALAMLLPSTCRYVGVLGPRHRTEKLLATLDATGRSRPEHATKLHAPVGLAIGAETPDEVALSIVAEIQAVLAGDTAKHLRDRPGRIHAAPVEAPYAAAGGGE
jgi:xanthine/CO dehydrogenase XdhC/CoxF family maturation factor